MQTPIVYGDILYVCRDNGVLSVFDAKTGTRQYQQRLGDGKTGFSASAVAVGRQDLLHREDGGVYVREGRPDVTNCSPTNAARRGRHGHAGDLGRHAASSGPARTFLRLARRSQGARSKEQGARNKEQVTRNKEQVTSNKEQVTRNKYKAQVAGRRPQVARPTGRVKSLEQATKRRANSYLRPASCDYCDLRIATVPCSLFLVPCSLFPVPCSLFLVPCSLFLVPFLVPPCSLFPVPFPRSFLLPYRTFMTASDLSPKLAAWRSVHEAEG